MSDIASAPWAVVLLHWSLLFGWRPRHGSYRSSAGGGALDPAATRPTCVGAILAVGAVVAALLWSG